MGWIEFNRMGVISMKRTTIKFPNYRFWQKHNLKLEENNEYSRRVAAIFFDGRRDVRQASQFKKPIRTALGRRNTLQGGNEAAQMLADVMKLFRIINEAQNVICGLLLIG